MASPKQDQTGSSLVEVLVALLLLSFCLLGLARLMAGNLRSHTESVIQANLNLLANDALGRIRSNPSELPESGAGNGYHFTASWSAQQGNMEAAPSPNCSASGCTNAERAAFDLWQLRSNARALLPQGAMTLVSNSNGNSNSTPNSGWILSLYWFDKDKESLGLSCQDSGANDLTCFNDNATGLQPVTGLRAFNFYFYP
jgi:type IV pilus modification protein PilV